MHWRYVNSGQKTSIGYGAILQLLAWRQLDWVVQDAVEGLKGSFTEGRSARGTDFESALFDRHGRSTGGQERLSKAGCGRFRRWQAGL